MCDLEFSSRLELEKHHTANFMHRRRLTDDGEEHEVFVECAEFECAELDAFLTSTRAQRDQSCFRREEMCIRSYKAIFSHMEVWMKSMLPRGEFRLAEQKSTPAAQEVEPIFPSTGLVLQRVLMHHEHAAKRVF